ncbi:DegT/DnrJ/EryC1/StrS family aminotransferase [Candidatus Gottesmanbacteria bacterium]|nr:DegT/DnrJ/EryC1/StrS family aminotransferase [Candidatus Gottesmanbacteria bacterium]
MKAIPFWNPLPEYETLVTEVHTAIARVLSSGLLILGPEVEAFEQAFSRFVGCRYGIGVGSGTDAITIGLRTLGIGKGDEVITAANTAIPTVAAIVASGASPKLVDAIRHTLLMDPTKLPRAMTKRTRCIIPVHLYGKACDMDEIMAIARAKNLFVLEDCAQATGAEYTNHESRITNHAKQVGSMGDIAAFSFYPTKIIGAYGDGGMITTNDAKLAKRTRMLRMYGTESSYIAKIPGGINSRLDELHAAVLSVKLKHIKRWIKERQRLANRYTNSLKHTPLVLPSVDPHSTHVFHLYVVGHKERDEIRKYLEKHGITTAIHYPLPIHLMPAYKDLGYKKGDFPVAEEASQSVFSLPLYPGLSEEEQSRVITTLHLYFKK